MAARSRGAADAGFRKTNGQGVNATGIVGAGAFGSALACVLARNNHDVVLWGRNRRAMAEIGTSRSNANYLPNHRIPAGVRATSRLDDLSGVSRLLMVLPSHALAAFLSRHGLPADRCPVVLCAKGIDPKGFRLQTEILDTFAPERTAAVLTGPGFADDLASGKPAAMTIACRNPDEGLLLQNSLSTPAFRLYLSEDITGAQLGGALKNVVAIACGLAIGSRLGESARAALITRGWAEVVRIGVALGAHHQTLAGLSGFGDLVLTCTSRRSRNYSLGLALGSGSRPTTGTTVEGVNTARAASGLARKLGIVTPVIEAVVRVLDGEESIEDALESLMSRPLRSE